MECVSDVESQLARLGLTHCTTVLRTVAGSSDVHTAGTSSGDSDTHVTVGLDRTYLSELRKGNSAK